MSAEVWAYVAVTFGISWVGWIVCIALHTREEYLLLGSAGPAFAAMILSRRREIGPLRSPLMRASLFVAVLAFGWAILCLNSSWMGSSNLSYRLNPWLLVCAIPPAWIVSGACSQDLGVRNLLRRLVHPPQRWSLIALLLFPAIMGIPAVTAYMLHQRLVFPARHGSATAGIAVAAVVFLYNVLFAAILEEPGWRGFLLDRLQIRRSPLVATLMVWLPWALWHAPLDYSRPGGFSLVMYLEVRVVFLIPLAIILTWLYNR